MKESGKVSASTRAWSTTGGAGTADTVAGAGLAAVAGSARVCCGWLVTPVGAA